MFLNSVSMKEILYLNAPKFFVSQLVSCLVGDAFTFWHFLGQFCITTLANQHTIPSLTTQHVGISWKQSKICGSVHPTILIPKPVAEHEIESQDDRGEPSTEK